MASFGPSAVGAVLFSCTLLPVAASAADVGGDPRPSAPYVLHVRWVEIDTTCPVDTAEVEREVRRILAPAGIDLAWSIGDVRAEAAPDVVHVIVLSSALGRRGHRTMGATFLNWGKGAWVSCPEVARTLNVTVRSCGDDCRRDMSTAMGRVVAHELVHVVAPEVRHAGAGVMAAVLSARDLRRDGLGLDPDARRAIRARLMAGAVGLGPRVATRGPS